MTLLRLVQLAYWKVLDQIKVNEDYLNMDDFTKSDKEVIKRNLNELYLERGFLSRLFKVDKYDLQKSVEDVLER